MKKFFAILALLIFTTNAVSAASWYEYNDAGAQHPFQIKYPDNWKVYTDGDDIQSFGPEDEEKSALTIREYSGQSYDQVLNLIGNEEPNSKENIILSTSTEDIIAKRLSYDDESILLIKRGSLTLAIIRDLSFDQHIADQMEATFKFTDDWHQYINLSDNYSFIFPSDLTLSNTGTGVEVAAPDPIFEIEKFEGIEIAKVAEVAKSLSETLEYQKNLVFHGNNKAMEAVYKDKSSDKKFGKIFVENDDSSFGITNVNIEDNYPSPDHFYDDIIEMIESFEFFEIDLEGYEPFTYFPDVRGSHINAPAINALFEAKVINGYPDGTFGPEGEINRAEFTKMVVASITEPDPSDYNGCFDDVASEWFAPYICYAKEQGWVEGYEDGDFRPESNINRVEAIKITLEALVQEVDSVELQSIPYTDILLADWYGSYFAHAYFLDLLDTQHTTDTNFYPGENMTRKEVAEMIFRSQKI